MTKDKTLTISRELLERCTRTIMKPRDETVQRRTLNELRDVLAQEAGPVVERQPVAEVQHGPFDDVGAPQWVRVVTLGDFDLEHFSDGTKFYTSPPAPVAAPDGWKLVPVEPTELMICRGDQNYSWSVAKIYKAMIADAPTCLDKVKELNQ